MSTWHEVEVELTGGDQGLLETADELLRRDGLRPDAAMPAAKVLPPAARRPYRQAHQERYAAEQLFPRMAARNEAAGAPRADKITGTARSFVVLADGTVAGITASSLLLPRLAR